MKISDLAVKLQAELINLEVGSAADVELTKINGIVEANPGEITFLTSSHYAKYLGTTKASAIIVGKPIANSSLPQLVHKNPYHAFAQTAQIFAPKAVYEKGVSKEAFVHERAKIADDVSVYPNVYISEGADIASGCVLMPGIFIGKNVKVGKGSILHANVVLEDDTVIGERALIHAGSVLGADGFGFAPSKEGIAKIPQVGNVVLGDDVEVGGLCTIDRAAMGSTKIGNGTKLDSNVHVGHNVTVGEHSMLCGCSKIAGSADIGNFCVLGGDASVSNHVTLSDGVRIGAKSGVTRNLTEPGDYMGFPSVPASQWRKEVVGVRRLQGLEDRVKELEALVKKYGV